jgi:hypothetical protein
LRCKKLSFALLGYFSPECLNYRWNQGLEQINELLSKKIMQLEEQQRWQQIPLGSRILTHSTMVQGLKSLRLLGSLMADSLDL